MRRRPAFGVTAAIAALVIASSGGAQAPAAKPESLVVSLLTLGPGKELFDRFGHTAIRVRSSLGGLDSAWNWGMYDFNAPNFIPRFLTGETQYWMAGFPTPFFVNYYRENHRAVWEQELALSAADAEALLNALRINALPANKFYRYDYYLDNCSTRARDAIDGALKGALRAALGAAAVNDGVTFRSETIRLSEAFPAIAFGMTFALGPRADAQISPWEEAFIPMRLRDRLREVRIPDSTGTRLLVRQEREIVSAAEFVDAAAAPSYAMVAGLVGVVLGVVIILLGGAASKNGGARFAIGAGGALWHLVLGVAGTLVLLAGLFTRHTFMGGNASVLLGTPVSLALAWFHLRGWSKSASPATRKAATTLSVVAAVAAIAAVVVHIVPAMSPADFSPALLVAPVQVALARALVRATRNSGAA
jgi:hypothetical protein